PRSGAAAEPLLRAENPAQAVATGSNCKDPAQELLRHTAERFPLARFARYSTASAAHHRHVRIRLMAGGCLECSAVGSAPTTTLSGTGPIFRAVSRDGGRAVGSALTTASRSMIS